MVLPFCRSSGAWGLLFVDDFSTGLASLRGYYLFEAYTM
jgi:hypothetical protein